MSDVGQWLFHQQRAMIETIVDEQAPTLATVNTVGATTVTLLDPLTGLARAGNVTVVGEMPGAGERVLVITLSDGEPVALRLASHAVPLVPSDFVTYLGNYLVTASGAQSSADTGSTTSTVNYSSAISVTMALPPGTWSVKAIGGLCIANTGGTANWLLSIDANNGTQRALSVVTEMQMIDDHSLGGIAGNRTITMGMWFKSSSAGTTSVRNPWLYAVGMRTA